MAYSKNILPRSAEYYTLSRASITSVGLVLESNGSAEISISKQMLAAITGKTLIVVHASTYSSNYTNDAVQVSLSLITSDGQRVECLIPAVQTQSGVYNTEVALPEGEFTSFTYTISSSVPVTIYNWELCAEDVGGISTTIEGIQQELPRLLYDYNMYAYSVGQKEQVVGLITCYLNNATDLQGHFTISFFATERCNVHVRIKDNRVTELFSPQVYTVEKGYASISIPHAYLKKLATDHAFSVTMQCSNGQLSVPVRGVLYTIDGGYLATRLLDAGVDVLDISIKQTSSDDKPSEIWAIGYESTNLVLKKCPYDLVLSDWEVVKVFDVGLAAAIEFAGHWRYRQRAEKATIETDETPMVFIVDLDGALKCYSGSDFSSVTTLDTGVSKLSACLGFDSMTYEEDQGLICAYIKSGNAYYRQYAYSDSTGVRQWISTQPLREEGDAKSVSVHRLPDYRLGICVEHDEGTKWLITNRTYVSQGVKPELAETSVHNTPIVTVIDASKTSQTYTAGVRNTFTPQPVGVGFNGFSLTFVGNLLFLNNGNVDDLIRSMVIYMNSVLVQDPTTVVSTVTIVDNVMTFYFKEDVPAGYTVNISFPYNDIACIIYNGCYMWIYKQYYIWELPAPEVFAPTENASIGASGSANTTVRPIVTRIQTMPQETFGAQVNALANTTVGALTESSVSSGIDTANPISVSSSVSITVQQTGTTPV